MPSKIDCREFLLASGATAGLAAAPTSLSHTKAVRMRVIDLRADSIERPLGLENPRPRLSWRLQSPERNVRQTAYRIRVASSEAALQAGRGDLWDSGKIDSGKSLGIPYQGRALISRQRCWWSVEVWDASGGASAPSEASWWEMGLLHPQDWSGQWLAAEDAVARADRLAGWAWIWGAPGGATPRKFRFKFQLPAPSASGEILTAAYNSAIAGLWVDGQAVERSGSATLSGEWLPLRPMSAGEHVLAVEAQLAPSLTAGIDNSHGLIFLLRLHLQNGETVRIASGPHCKTALDEEGDWYQPGYDDKTWEAARAVPLANYQPWPARPAMVLRRTFSCDSPVLEARLYATALGAYEARLNGQRVGDALLTPEMSQYAKRALYRVYDVTSLLVPGENAWGLIVGDGWYASFDGRFAWALPPRRVLAQLEIRFADHSRQIISTGPGWHAAESAIRQSEIRVGEIYDARLEQPGWDGARFDDTHWQDAHIAEKPPCRLVAQTSPPIRAMQVLQPHAITQPKPGVYRFDFGLHFSGWCRLHVQGARGSRIELKFAELLTPRDELDESLFNIGEPKKDVFILKGEASGETFEPYFTYRGFRYVEVTGLAVPPTAQSLEGIFVHSDLQTTGKFRIDAPLIEQIWRNTLRTQQSNLVGVATDCPSREQRGYTASAGIAWDSAAFHMDVCALTSRLMDNVVDDQSEEGAFPIVAPEPHHSDVGSFFFYNGTPPGWGDGGIILPWTAWRRYGDLALVERHWQAMNRHVEFILNNNPDYLWRNKRSHDFGDWLALDHVASEPENLNPAPTTPRDLIGTAYWAHSADLLSQMAQALGRQKDAQRLRTLFEHIGQAFNDAFVQTDGTVGDGSQTCYILALRFGLLSEGVKRTAAERLAEDIRRRGVSLTTGILGTQFSLDVLADAGYADLAYGLLLRSEYPSWGYMIRRGATTIWETWSGEIKWQGKTVSLARNHPDLGSICGFLFRRIAGIDAATPGFEKIIIRPVLDARVKRGGGDYDSVMGRISTDWTQVSDSRFTLEVTIPPNATAHVYLPAGLNSRIEEGRREIAHRRDMQIVARLHHEAVVEVGSGTYRFVVTGYQRAKSGGASVYVHSQ